MKIGGFSQDSHGVMHGRIYGLGLGATSVIFEPQVSKENKEYFRVIADPVKEAYEIGVAFPKEKNGKVYYSVSIESPALPAPINAALFQDKDTGTYSLIWNRPIPAGPKAEASNGNTSRQAQNFASPNVN